MRFKNIELMFGDICKGMFWDTKIFCQDISRGMRQPIGEQECGILGKIAIVKDEEKFAAVIFQPLDRVWYACREKPQISL